jgi:hypothetical protein
VACGESHEVAESKTSKPHLCKNDGPPNWQAIISDEFHQKSTLDFPLDSHPSRQLQKPHRKARLGRINIPTLSQGI